MKLSHIIPFCSLTIVSLLAASGTSAAGLDSMRLTGDLATDLGITRFADRAFASDTSLLSDTEIESERSVLLAGTLSAILPGAGQIYAEAPLWRTLLYGGIEAAGWATYFAFGSKGERTTAEFESYADTHWDVTRYIDWIAANYKGWSSEAVDRKAAEEALRNIYRSSDRSLPPWQRVDFVALNRLERAVKQGFSHTLPEHGDQQYYEEIGKYTQYRAGWDDHNPDGDTSIYDPSRVTARNRSYMDIRASANRYLGYASAALGTLIVNHLASMLDAALTARSFNASLTSRLHGRLLPDGTFLPAGELHLTVRF